MIKNIREKFFNRNIITIYRHTYKSTRLVTRRARIELFEALRESRMAERVVAVADKRTRKMVEERERERENLYLSSRLEKKPFLDFLPRDPPCIPFPLLSLSGKRESYETVRPLCRICLSLPRRLRRILTNKITRRHELLSLSFLPSFDRTTAQRSPTPMIHPPFRRLDYAESLVPCPLFRVVLLLLLNFPLVVPFPPEGFTESRIYIYIYTHIIGARPIFTTC